MNVFIDSFFEADGASSHFSLPFNESLVVGLLNLRNLFSQLKVSENTLKMVVFAAFVKNASYRRKLTLVVFTILACSLFRLVRRLMLVLRRVNLLLIHDVPVFAGTCTVKEIKVARQRENARNSKNLRGARPF